MRREPLEVLGQRPVLVVADERADDLHAELLRRIDHLQEMAVHLLAMLVIRVEVVRVVRERRDLEAVPVEHVADRSRVERVDVDVRDARVASSLSPARRPAGDLERLESLAGSPGGDLLERQIRKRGGEQAELQRATSTQAPVRADSAIASQSRISSCPSAKVGKSGSAGIAPFSTARYTAR